MMQGRIWIESPRGDRNGDDRPGSVFHFTATFGVRPSVAAEPAPQPRAGWDGLPVLIVDDNATNRRLLVEMLRHWRLHPTAVDSGPAALEALAQALAAGRPFPLVILDFNMPGMDGPTVATRIRENAGLRDTRIMILTSAGLRGDAARCRSLGIDAYLLKPIKESDLLKAVGAVMGSEEAPERRRSGLLTRHSLRVNRPQLRILLAEDNPVNQRLATRLLEKQGHQVLLAKDGREAVAMVERDPVDLVLMDVQMPNMDGLQATAAIREREKKTGAHVPIVAVTAHAMKGDEERCLEAGMDGYVSKPIQVRELEQAIDRFCCCTEPLPTAPARC